MKKNKFRQLIDRLFRTKRGFTKLIDNPSGSKMAKRTSTVSRRGCDGTLRR